MADYPGAIEMFVPSVTVFPNALGYQRKWLVLHKTAGGNSARSVARWFQSGADGRHTSVHYVVGPDGEVVQCVREKDGAGGNCCLEAGADTFWPRDLNLNLVTFSIESVDPSTDNSTPIPPAQKQALFLLVKDLCLRHSIPLQPANIRGGITGHNSIAPQSRSRCPGNFPWLELWSYLKGEEKEAMLQLSDPMGRYFQEISPDHWRCKNGVDLIGAHLKFYRRHEGVFGLPLTKSVVLPQSPNVKLVVYECALAADDPSASLEGAFPSRGRNGCYLIHLDSGPGQEIVAQPLLGELQHQIDRLQAQLNDQDADVLMAMRQALKQIQSIVQQFSS